jgi:hypothetical protein
MTGENQVDHPARGVFPDHRPLIIDDMIPEYWFFTF